MYDRGLQKTEWFIGALTALVVILFLVFAIAMCRLAKRGHIPEKRIDDEVHHSLGSSYWKSHRAQEENRF